MPELRVPVATYRLQLSRDFRFEDARKLVGYLKRLGVSDLYSSPILKARRGSQHCYDVTDPTQLNPELGTPADFEALSSELKSRGMGLLLDIVPNHMAASTENPFWLDVLENGPESRYASFFDIDWNPADSPIRGKVLLPVLGRPYGEALEDGELVLALEGGWLFVRYYDTLLPLNVRSYASVFSRGLDSLSSRLGPDSPAVRQANRLLEDLRSPLRDSRSLKRDFEAAISANPQIRACLESGVALFNGVKGDPRSFDLLDGLLSRQAYRLAYWKSVREEINYRRFFDISDLVGIRVEEPKVFDDTHELVLRLVSEGRVTGLRLDHIDGLRDPLRYLRRLQGAIAGVEESSEKGFYVLVEKILSGGEPLREEWPVFGTTGYGQLNRLNAVLVDWDGMKRLRAVYQRATGLRASFEDVAYEKQVMVAYDLFPGELRSLAYALHTLAQNDRHALDVARHELQDALTHVTACLSVYRTYISDMSVSSIDREYVEQAVARARERRFAPTHRGALDFARRVLTLDFPPNLPQEGRDAWLEFVMRWQQFTGPIMAKGFEDTALYNYSPLISLNAVGGEPGAESFTVGDFHRRNADRQRLWPHGLTATSTHDAKRGEDVTARITVLSEIPGEWRTHLNRWRRWNRASRKAASGQDVPNTDLEMLIYQTMLGAWPFDEGELAGFGDRLKEYVVKAAREAKFITSWLSPDEEAERALTAFVDALLEDSARNLFLGDFTGFQRRVAFYGALNSLSQVVLKTTTPGVPDFYQGAELWDFSLVDPDNRRPVDFERRIALLDGLERACPEPAEGLLPELMDSWRDGRIKLYVAYRALQARNALRAVFENGEYIPFQAQGGREQNICAFARRNGDAWAIAAVPRYTTRLVNEGRFPIGGRVWRNDTLKLPQNAPSRWRNAFSGEMISVADGSLPLAEVFASFPVALLVSGQ